jgi:hypothetical protein
MRACGSVRKTRTDAQRAREALVKRRERGGSSVCVARVARGDHHLLVHRPACAARSRDTRVAAVSERTGGAARRA